MSEIALNVAGELAKAHAEHDLILERIQKLEEIQKLADELDDIERPADELDTDEATPAAKASPPESPKPPAPRRSSTSAGRRPASPTRAASQSKGSHLGQTDGGGASAGGRRVVAADVIERIPAALAKLGRATPTAIGLELGYAKGTSGIDAVREAIVSLTQSGKVKVDGNVRGRPAYSLVAAADSAAVPAGDLVDRVLAYIKENGPRTGEDLRDELEVDGDELSTALARGLTQKRLNKVVQSGLGRVVYRAAGGE